MIIMIIIMIIKVYNEIILDWLTPSFGCFADARNDDPTTQRVIARAQPEAIQKKHRRGEKCFAL
jgi:hypothetical protein